MASISNILGAGSGIDTKTLIDELVAAERDPRVKLLTARAEKNDARVSGIAQVRAGIDAFADALDSLATGDVLASVPVSGDATVIGITRTAGAAAANLSASVEVRRLAAAQVVASAATPDRTAPIGQGVFTIGFGRPEITGGAITGFTANPARPDLAITVDATNDSLDGLAAAINAANAGVTASIVTDANGVRLVLKGATGADNGFRVTTTAADGTTLAALGFAPGDSDLTLSTAAANAEIAVDGVVVERSSNSVADLLPGFTLDLKKAAVGVPVALSATRDTGNLSTAVTEYVGAYNEVLGLIAELTKPAAGDDPAGPLRGDASIRDLQRRLASLTTQSLVPGGSPASLSEVGVRTNRDGSLSVDSARLADAVARWPERVEAMFVRAQSADSPLVTVTSALGRAKTGSYALTDLVGATAGTLTAAASPTAFDTPVDIDGSNNGFSVTLDGKASLALAIAPGSYATGASLAAAFQTAINADPVLKSFDKAALVRWTGSGFEIRSRALGADSTVALAGLSPALEARLGLATAVAVGGSNASGKIDGVAAIGNGARLTASALSAAAGLVVEVRAGVTAATVHVTNGIGGSMRALQTALSGSGGLLASVSERLGDEADAIADAQAKVDARAATMRAQLTKQFAAMEKAVAAFKATQTYLEQQIDLWTNGDN